MDFVEIRRKAKERVAARAGEPARERPASAVPPVPHPAEEPAAHEPAPRSREEAAFEPAPRWPGLAPGEALVAALREELVGGDDVSPEPPRDGGAPAAPEHVEEAPSAEPAGAWTVPADPAPRWDPQSAVDPWPAPAPAPPEALREPPPPDPASPPRLAGAFPPDQWTLSATRLPDPVAPIERPAPARAEPDPLAEFFFDAAEAAPAIDDLGGPSSPAVPQPDGGDARRELLGFVLGEEEYAVDIEKVHEVLKAPAITEVPRAPAHVLGVIMVRGEVIPVFDPRRRLALPAAPPTRASRVLVCDAGEGAIGLLVDAVSQVVRLRPSDVEPRPQGIGGVAADYIAGIGRDEGRLFILLDLRAILRGAAAKEARA